MQKVKGKMMKNGYSAIAVDIDGTLLNSKGRISDKTLNALRKCEEKGILVYLATARSPRLVFRQSEASNDADFIKEKGTLHNGAVAIDKQLDYIKYWQIPAETVNSIAKFMENELSDIYIAIQRKDESHGFRLALSDDDLQSWLVPKEKIVPFAEASENDCMKIIAWHSTLKMTDIYQRMNEQYKGKANVFITDSASWLQVVSYESSKENALKHLFSLRNIPSEGVIVFGDDMPDVGMFKTFGHSVAMGNSPGNVKSMAKYVTKSNDEDGIVYALEEYFGII
ncbi:MAG: HAD family hydrolase [Candidatus Poribacteria bacterium]